MKTVIIGDIHGHDSWKQIIAQEQDADRFIFVGDYFDSFTVPGLKQCENFQDIIEFKTTTDKEVILLVGNHDFHYYPEIGDNGTSGYQGRMSPTINHIINTNREHLQLAYRMDEFVFSHAGLSEEWLNDNIVGWNVDNMVDKVNELFQFQPKKIEYRSFKYYNYGDPNQQAQLAGGFGDETFQGPLWIRPRALMVANYDTLRNQVIQVVGHTPNKQIDIKGMSTGGRYYFIDTLPREYLIVTDGVVSLGKLNNEKAETAKSK
jgi:hypothetical protein